jgi:hypothetical protein
MTHDEANAAQLRYFALDDLKRAAHLIERSIGVFAQIDDKSLTLARSYVGLVMDCNKIEAPKSGGPLPGDVKF